MLLYRALPFWRFIWPEGESSFYQVFGDIKLPFYMPIQIFRFIMSRTLFGQTFAHGVGRHSKEEILNWMKDDLRTTSRILGDKKYMTGDKPCVEDCGIFGLIVQVVYGMPDSPYDEFVKSNYNGNKFQYLFFQFIFLS